METHKHKFYTIPRRSALFRATAIGQEPRRSVTKMGFATICPERKPHADSGRTQTAWPARAATGSCRNLPCDGLRQAFRRSWKVAGLVSGARLPVLFRIHRGI